MSQIELFLWIYVINIGLLIFRIIFFGFFFYFFLKCCFYLKIYFYFLSLHCFKILKKFLYLFRVNNIIKNHLIYYPTTKNLNYNWSLGLLSGLFLRIQIITGLLIAIFYTRHVDIAFLSIENVRREVSYGWLLRYSHSNGASFFFICVYLHRLRSLYYRSYNDRRIWVWLTGIIIFFIIIRIAFIGYVLPWGQISYWGATVITNLFSAIPFVGYPIVQWLWGGFTLGNPTLNRFFIFHFILPFVLIILVFFHLRFLHTRGSSNPLSLETGSCDYIRFYPYFYVKDLFLFLCRIFIFIFIVCFNPNFFNHPDNYIIANSLVTPTHIVPEWYFLIFYRILRVVPQKLGGVLLIFGSIFILFYIRYRWKKFEIIFFTVIRNSFLNVIYQVSFWIFVVILILLTWLGRQPAVEPFLTRRTWFVFLYFFFFLAYFIIVWIFEYILVLLFSFNVGESKFGFYVYSRGINKILGYRNRILYLIYILKFSSQKKYLQFFDLNGIDQPGKIYRFILIYRLKNFISSNRYYLNFYLSKKIGINSLGKLYISAVVLEREMWDRFGIPFYNRNFELRRLLTDYGFKDNPICKDFPITGFYELTYFYRSSVIKYLKVELIQQYRLFTFENIWVKEKSNNNDTNSNVEIGLINFFYYVIFLKVKSEFYSGE